MIVVICDVKRFRLLSYNTFSGILLLLVLVCGLVQPCQFSAPRDACEVMLVFSGSRRIQRMQT